MSDAVFPVLPGLAFDVVKTPNFSTTVQRSRSGRELRRSNWSSPIMRFSLNYEFLRDETVFDELKALAGFYMQRQGSFDSFLFFDPDDNAVVNQQFGVGDSVTTQYYFKRDFGGSLANLGQAFNIADGAAMWSGDLNDPMWSGDLNAPMWSDIIYRATDYTISSSGLITFNAAVPDGAVLRWSGSFYYRCRFDADSLDFNKFMHQLWSLGTCDLVGSLDARI